MEPAGVEYVDSKKLAFLSKHMENILMRFIYLLHNASIIVSYATAMIVWSFFLRVCMLCSQLIQFQCAQLHYNPDEDEEGKKTRTSNNGIREWLQFMHIVDKQIHPIRVRWMEMARYLLDKIEFPQY